MKIFVSGSCRLLVSFNDSHKELYPIHSLNGRGGYKGNNFLGKLHNTKQHIQFIKFIKDEIYIPNNILSKFLTSYNNTIKIHANVKCDDISLSPKKKENLKNQFDECEWYIFEICSIKIYRNDKFYVQYELTNDYETPVTQTEEELYNDLKTIREIIPKNKKILFQVHFRPNIIYNNNNIINNREIIYKVVNKFCNENENTYIYDPSIILNKNKNLFNGNNHFTTKGHNTNYKYIYNNFINKEIKLNEENNLKINNNIKYNSYLLKK